MSDNVSLSKQYLIITIDSKYVCNVLWGWKTGGGLTDVTRCGQQMVLCISEKSEISWLLKFIDIAVLNKKSPYEIKQL